MSNKNFSECYVNRFSPEERKRKNEMWKILCSLYIQKYVGKRDVVIDLGAGYCEFINNIRCGKKIAVDVNPDARKSANKDVLVINKNVLRLPKKFDASADIVFLSNFLEHLNSKNELLDVLVKVNGLLKENGKVILLQPNIDLVKESYWDFVDHKIALNTKSIKEALNISGFKILWFIRKFLPYTTKSPMIPMSTFLLKLYLRLPQIIKPFSGQSFVVAIKK